MLSPKPPVTGAAGRGKLPRERPTITSRSVTVRRQRLAPDVQNANSLGLACCEVCQTLSLLAATTRTTVKLRPDLIKESLQKLTMMHILNLPNEVLVLILARVELNTGINQAIFQNIRGIPFVNRQFRQLMLESRPLILDGIAQAQYPIASAFAIPKTFTTKTALAQLYSYDRYIRDGVVADIIEMTNREKRGTNKDSELGSWPIHEFNPELFVFGFFILEELHRWFKSGKSKVDQHILMASMPARVCGLVRYTSTHFAKAIPCRTRDASPAWHYYHRIRPKVPRGYGVETSEDGLFEAIDEIKELTEAFSRTEACLTIEDVLIKYGPKCLTNLRDFVLGAQIRPDPPSFNDWRSALRRLVKHIDDLPAVLPAQDVQALLGLTPSSDTHSTGTSRPFSFSSTHTLLHSITQAGLIDKATMLLYCNSGDRGLSRQAISNLRGNDLSSLSPENSVRVLVTVDWVKLVSDRVLKNQNSLFKGCSTVGELAQAAAQELEECFENVTATIKAMSAKEIRLMEAQIPEN